MGDSLLEDFANYRHSEALTAILVAVSMVAIIPIILLRDFVWLTLPAAGGLTAYALLALIHELRESPVLLKCGNGDFATFSRRKLALHSLRNHDRPVWIEIKGTVGGAMSLHARDVMRKYREKIASRLYDSIIVDDPAPYLETRIVIPCEKTVDGKARYHVIDPDAKPRIDEFFVYWPIEKEWLVHPEGILINNDAASPLYGYAAIPPEKALQLEDELDGLTPHVRYSSTPNNWEDPAIVIDKRFKALVESSFLLDTSNYRRMWRKYIKERIRFVWNDLGKDPELRSGIELFLESIDQPSEYGYPPIQASKNE